MNSIEEKLWNYIDGNCTADEQEAISRLIETDEVYRSKYEELAALNLEFSSMEIEEPSMGFTYKVMEAVRAEEAKVPLKAAVNKNVIRGLVGFFVFIITALIIYAVFSVNWSAGDTHGTLANYKLPQVSVPLMKMPQLTSAMSGFILKAFIFFDVVLGLFFLDAYLRKQRTSRHV